MKEKLLLHFLGGVGEVGKNCTALELGQDIIVIDGGMSFPTAEMPGIDVVIPDVTYLTQNAKRIKAFLITHGHEDHIGALPYILRDIKAPVYGSKLTLMLLENKLKEKNIHATMNVVKNGTTLNLGKFQVEFISVTHSIAGAYALSITTPQGIIVHSGDFKVDFTPVDGEGFNFARFAEIGKRGVTLFLADSTNAEKEGFSMSEKKVGQSLDRLFEEHKRRRIIVATFASNVHRVQQIVDIAQKFRRKVALSGRSMINVVEAALKIGEIKASPKIFVDIDNIDTVADKDLVIICTGSQGEPLSALSRMADGDFNKVKITPNDTVIISASPIPGNEKFVFRVINQLYKLGAEVIYSKLQEIHTSGHAAQEELKIFHSLIKPKFFIPVHGEYRHLVMHKKLAVQLGMKENKILIPEIGDSIEISRQFIKKSGHIQSGALFVDGLGFGAINSSMLKDRIHLSEEGVLVVVVAIDSSNGCLVDEPELVLRGIVLNDAPDKALFEAKQIVASIIEKLDLKSYSSRIDLKTEIRKRLRIFFQKRIRQRPMIIPIVVETNKKDFIL